MNGAQALLRTLAGCGVDVCFANPGTSEMHFVAALDAVPEMRGVLCLFEGVATGAADGYGRMTGRPAAALLHLGPGLANGLANLHNARRANTPLLAVVGDHASYHKRFDAPLESDIDAMAGAVSAWVRRPARPADVGADAAAGGRRRDGAARPGRHAHPARRRVLVRGRRAGAAPAASAPPAPVADEVIGAAAAALRSGSRACSCSAARACGGPAWRRRAGLAAGDRRPDAGRDVPGQARARRGHAAGRAAGLPGRVRGRAAGRHAPSHPGRGRAAGLLLRLPGPAKLARARRLPGARARRAQATTLPARWRRSPTSSLRTPSPLPQQPERPALPGRRPDRPEPRRRSSARCCRRGRSSATRPTPPACGWPAPRRARRRTTGSR